MTKKIISLALALIMALGMFSVPAMAAGVTLSLDQTDYKAGALITITFSGVTDGQIAAQAVVAYAKQGASASEYEKWTYVKQGSGTVTLWASKETGNYEMRFYQARSINETNLVSSATINFTVGGGSTTTQPPTTQPPTTQPPTTQPPAQTTDAPSSWAVEQINKAIAEKLVPQSLQSKYTQATTRAEFCALAVALYENIKGTITGRTTFTDTTDVNVEKMASIGVVSGIGNNKFDPDAKLTREQAAVMLSRLAEAVGKPFEKKAATFADNGKVSSWALEGVGQVQAAGIMGGVGNNTFAPKDAYTREQSIITILRTYDAVKGGGTTEPTKPTDPPTSGSIDEKLVGHWQYKGLGNIRDTITWNDSYYYDYFFYDDGSFSYFYQNSQPDANMGALAVKTKTEGKYSVSNGKIYFTEILYEAGTKNEERFDNTVFEYKFDKDELGEYLFIGSFKYNTPLVDISWGVKFRKQ